MAASEGNTLNHLLLIFENEDDCSAGEGTIQDEGTRRETRKVIFLTFVATQSPAMRERHPPGSSKDVTFPSLNAQQTHSLSFSFKEIFAGKVLAHFFVFRKSAPTEQFLSSLPPVPDQVVRVSFVLRFHHADLRENFDG